MCQKSPLQVTRSTRLKSMTMTKLECFEMHSIATPNELELKSQSFEVQDFSLDVVF